MSDDDDLYDGDYEFVDEDELEESDSGDWEETEEEVEEDMPKKTAKRKKAASKGAAGKKKKAPPARAKKKPAEDVETDEIEEEEGDSSANEGADEYGRPEPVANYVVHVYEVKKFKRTIDHAFTPEDAEAFATEYNRTSKPYGRWAVPGKADVKPGKVLAP